MKKEGPLINIPDPCNQKWEDMIAVDKNRFCTLCNKDIIDFTNKSNTEIEAYFTNNNEKVCGRFLNSQMQQNTVVTPFDDKQCSFKFPSHFDENPEFIIGKFLVIKPQKKWWQFWK